MKLLSMTDFVIENENMVKQTESEMSKDLFKLAKYAHFLKQPLEKFMFVPCDQDGNVLQKPTMFYSEENIKRLKGIEIEIANSANNRIKQYEDAKSKVLFENFKFVESHKEGMDNNLDYFVFPYGEKRLGLTKRQEGFRTWFQLFTVEDLVQCDLELSKNVIEEFQLYTI